MSPFERSKSLLEEQGYQVWKTERPATMWTPTLDLFNCIDLVAIRGDCNGVMGVQVCGEDIAPHVHKILEGYTKQKLKKNEIVMEVIPPNPYIKTWLLAGNRFFIWGWRLRKHKGTKDTYQLREVEMVLKGNDVTPLESVEAK